MKKNHTATKEVFFDHTCATKERCHGRGQEEQHEYRWQLRQSLAQRASQTTKHKIVTYRTHTHTHNTRYIYYISIF